MTHCIYVPVYCEGSIDGVLSVPLRGRQASSELFEQCQAVGHLTELALSNELAHEALAEQHRRLHAAEVIGHIGSWELDLETHAVTWSDTLFELYHLDPQSFGGDYQAAMSMIHPEDLEHLQAALDACEQTGAALDVRHRVVLPSDGRLRWFEVRAERVHDPGRPALSHAAR